MLPSEIHARFREHAVGLERGISKRPRSSILSTGIWSGRVRGRKSEFKQSIALFADLV